MRRRGNALVRYLECEGEPALVRAWPESGRIRLRAEGASEECARHAIDRMRFALGTDHDIGAFHRRFWRDPLLGPVVRRVPWLRPRRRPAPFEALAWAVCEQLIDGPRAVGIERRIVARHGPRSPCGSLRDVPAAEVVAGLSPAQVEACGLSPMRSVTLVKAAKVVARGHADLTRHEPTWRRLRAIRGIGPWTVEYLALHGQGRDDQIPAGDLAYLKLVGRLRKMGRRASEDEVREFFAPYAPYAGLAGTYLLHGLMAGAFPSR
jgi:3-methyladenine DNA glycosylase/8-oxoguanine DNA glycosylase